jgi:hypothetical protein
MTVQKMAGENRSKKSRAQEPCDSCALFQLRREVFKAPRLNLEALYSSHSAMARGLLAISCVFLCMTVEKTAFMS